MRLLKSRIFKLFVSVAIGVGLLEGLCSLLAWKEHGTLDVAELNARESGNSYLFELHRNGKSLAECRVPHPYLGYVNNKNFETYRADFPRRINNIGLVGEDVPLKHDPSKFTILLTGGSVAMQFGSLGNLPDVLSTRYAMNKPVVLLNVANGAWKQPQQAIAVLLYGEVADAVVTLDGFNEHHRFLGGRGRLEQPVNGVNQSNNEDFDRVGAAWQANQLRRFSLRHNSRALYYLTRTLRNRIEAGAQEAPDDNSAFLMPREWSEEDRVAFNLLQYRKYIRFIDAMAGDLKIKTAHFIQPCPAIGKTLTTDETRVVGKLEYAGAYREMTNHLLALNESGIPVVSLLDCFEGHNETLYDDASHCDIHGPGYRIMAERIAAELAKLWKLPEKQQVQK